MFKKLIRKTEVFFDVLIFDVFIFILIILAKFQGYFAFHFITKIQTTENQKFWKFSVADLFGSIIESTV